MKRIYDTIIWCFSFSLMLGIGLTSCEDYLDKDPDSIVGEGEAFKDFMNFQGFVEEIYNCIPDKAKNYWTTSWNWGDDEIMNPNADWHMVHQVDLGNFWAWQGGRLAQAGCWLDKPSGNLDPKSQDPKMHGLWGHAWYCIRKANLGLENLDKFIGTQEERNLIEGQLYFFRAWWHFEMIQFVGGLPYIDRALSASEQLTLPRLSYQECADKIAVDFRKAADLLPVDWDKTKPGRQTVGNNQLRLNKIMALGYLGKNYLWAGSPLMKNGAQTGGTQTYNYDEEYCRKAAEAFGELLSLVESGQTQYGLAQFKYKDVYNHVKADDAATCYSDIFISLKQSWRMPGSSEAIFRGPSVNAWTPTRYNLSRTFGPNPIMGQDNVVHQPTANYVENYGMANGLPLDDPDSEYDTEYPFKNRDPRFYHDIVFDGFKYINGSPAADKKQYQYASLYTDGAMRNVSNSSRTGYFYQKLVPHTCNIVDEADSYGGNPHVYIPYMRLADIYLMYAEACAAVAGASGKADNYGKTAEGAINVLRDRVGVGHVNAKFTNDKNKFMDEVRRERAVELAFEGFRFNDLQRWLLLTEKPYIEKTSHEFKRVENDEFFTKNDPKDARVAELKEVVVLTRQFTAKHYWFPLKISDTSMYEGFDQNPGW